MCTLSDCYKNIASNYSSWSYYYEPNVTINDTWKDECKAFDFIKNYLKIGEKNSLFDEISNRLRQKILISRSPHIVSAYLLGIIIADAFGIDVKKRSNENTNFLYMYFLTCLYHDYGYIFEKDRNNQQYLVEIFNNGFDSLSKIGQIDYIDDMEFTIFNKKQIECYAKIRANDFGVIDHGIFGGLLLYDRLIKNFYNTWKKVNSPKCNIDDFYYWNNDRKLHYSKKHFALYGNAANAIMAHNIFFDAFNNGIQKHNYDVEKITTKISPSNEIAYILSIADTIEPLKNKIDLSALILKRENGSFELEFVNKNDFEKSKSHIMGLIDWVDVFVEERKNCFKISKAGE